MHIAALHRYDSWINTSLVDFCQIANITYPCQHRHVVFLTLLSFAVEGLTKLFLISILNSFSAMSIIVLYLHASNFPSKLLSIGLIEKLDEKKSIGAHRSPTYYRFNEERYEEALKEGLVLV